MKVKITKVPQRANNGLTVENDAVTPLSPQTFNLGGKPHSEGGTNINFNGVTVEAEKGETISLNNQGDLVVMGNLRIPGSQTKFKTAAKRIGEEEGKATKQLIKGQDLISLNDPYDKYESLSFNAGLVKNDAANQKLKAANQQKELLGNLQQMMLDGSEILGVKPEKFEQTVKKAQNGATLFSPVAGNPFNIQYPNWQTAQYAAPQQVFIPTPIEAVAPNAQGTLAQRNNNPGNLRFANQKGATKGDRGFARFNSYEEGFQALMNDLRSKQTGKSRTGLKPGSTLQDLINVYAPKADNNDPTSYANTVAKQLGVNTNTPISGLNTNNLALAMAQVEDRAYASSKGNTPTSVQPTPQETISYEDPTPRQRPLLSLEQVGLPQPQARFQTQYVNPRTQQFQDAPPEYMQQAPQYTSQRSTEPLPSLADRNRLNPLDFLPEIGAILDRPDYVPLQQYTPQLMTPTSFSFQDQLNANQASFNALSRNFANNPEALSTLAAGAYQANQSVLGNEFRTNQQNFQNVSNQNVGTINDAQLRNIQLRDTQADRQTRAQAITDQNRQNALQSISDSYAQRRAFNTNLRLGENFFNYRPDENYQQQYVGPDYDFMNGQQPVPIQNPQTPQDTALQTQQSKYQQQQLKTEQERLKLQRSKNRTWFGNWFK